MGFLKFLKREKKGNDETELDLPPAPPPLGGFDEKMPDIPDFRDFGDDNKPSSDDLGEFDLQKNEAIMPDLGNDDISNFPSFPDIDDKQIESIPPIRAPPISPVSQIPQEMPEVEEVAAQQSNLRPYAGYPRMEGEFSHQDESLQREMPSGKSIYVRVDKFKATLGNINILRNDLKKSEEALIKFENIKNAKDRSFDRVKSSLEDIQKKLIFIDKTLFKVG